MKKRKILRYKEQSTVQPTVQSNYVYCVVILPVLAIGIYVFFAQNAFQSKKQAN